MLRYTVGLKLNEVVNRIDDFSEQRDWGQFHTLKNLVSSICIEASEMLECFQWIDPSKQDVLNDRNLDSQIQQEIADVLIYALRLCSILDYDPIKLILTKLELNDEKYPVQLSKGSSAKYNQIKKGDNVEAEE